MESQAKQIVKKGISIQNGPPGMPNCPCWREFESISHWENTGSAWVWRLGNSAPGGREVFEIIAYHPES